MCFQPSSCAARICESRLLPASSPIPMKFIVVLSFWQLSHRCGGQLNPDPAMLSGAGLAKPARYAWHLCFGGCPASTAVCWFDIRSWLVQRANGRQARSPSRSAGSGRWRHEKKCSVALVAQCDIPLSKRLVFARSMRAPRAQTGWRLHVDCCLLLALLRERFRPGSAERGHDSQRNAAASPESFSDYITCVDEVGDDG